MNKEGLNGATVVAPRQLTCWPAFQTAGDCALKKDTHSGLYHAKINPIALISDTALQEENNVF